MADYLQKAKILSDNLVAIGEFIIDSELIQYVLGGLGPDYESLVTSLVLRLEDYTCDEIQALLSNHELRMEQSKLLFDVAPFANFASRSTLYRSPTPKTDAGKNKNKTNREHKSNPYQGVKCQICLKPNHKATMLVVMAQPTLQALHHSLTTVDTLT
ncbi:PREDICTED: uncharacterized protein LOC104612926 [Nelumbo nucifera]|uniref:Uncharacterized protein LOC104612926 n=1 Tax=Nelumbo nucifera TaxID=4432 RepID=A0A1U8BFM9_NELNU|nr:PREDICTED: uncharacterized protein LOC104612926 [Nelumbo nucifera]